MIKATVRYTSEHYKALYKSYSDKSWVRLLISTVLSTLLTAAYAAYMVWYYLRYGFDIICLIGFIAVAAVITSIIRSLTRYFGSMSELKNMVPVRELRCFVFDDEKFCMLCKREGFYLDQRIHYTELVSAREVNDFFFIMVDQGRVCIIGKNELTEGTPEELRNLLYEKMGDKFSVNIK